jgi:hypothetical protein
MNCIRRNPEIEGFGIVEMRSEEQRPNPIEIDHRKTRRIQG